MVDEDAIHRRVRAKRLHISPQEFVEVPMEFLREGSHCPVRVWVADEGVVVEAFATEPFR